MNSSRTRSDDRERIFLAFLCQGLPDGALRAELQDLLASRSWQSDDHRAVFGALKGWQAPPDAIRSGLAARLTRLGFPDTDIEEYFAPPEVSIETALGWLRDESAGKRRVHAGRRNSPDAGLK